MQKDILTSDELVSLVAMSLKHAEDRAAKFELACLKILYRQAPNGPRVCQICRHVENNHASTCLYQQACDY